MWASCSGKIPDDFVVIDTCCGFGHCCSVSDLACCSFMIAPGNSLHNDQGSAQIAQTADVLMVRIWLSIKSCFKRTKKAVVFRPHPWSEHKKPSSTAAKQLCHMEAGNESEERKSNFQKFTLVLLPSS